MTNETTLLRQVHPSFIPDGQMTSQAFMPFPRDDSKLSVYDGDHVSAGESYQHYTGALNNESDGVWGVTCTEVEAIDLASAIDPLPDSPAHAIIDFSGKSTSTCRKLAKKLTNFARARGRLHP
jgi:hypothetical protein